MLAPIRKQIDNLFMCMSIANLITDKSNLHRISLLRVHFDLSKWPHLCPRTGACFLHTRGTCRGNCTFTVSDGESFFVSFEYEGPIRTVDFVQNKLNMLLTVHFTSQIKTNERRCFLIASRILITECEFDLSNLPSKIP